MFDSVIANPLATVLGQTLLNVDYWILNCDQAGFAEEKPNASGVMAIRLRFETSELQVTWGFKKPLRADGVYYHVQLSLEDEGQEAAGFEAFVRVAEIGAAWREAQGRRLTHVEVLGVWDSPQAVRFSFSDAVIIAAAGYSGNPLLVGDGDEILIFSGQEWPDRSSTHDQPWERLWSASTVVPSEAFAK